LNRQDANRAKNSLKKFFSWRSWRLGGSVVYTPNLEKSEVAASGH
jgi:hypothetical protein